MKQNAFITGVTGQDGSYLAELLLEKGYTVWGLLRRTSSSNTERIDHLRVGSAEGQSRFRLVDGDMTDGASLIRLLQRIEPDEIYNLAAQSQVHASFGIPDFTAQVDGLGALRLLEAVHVAGLVGHVRYYQASTSELFGRAARFPLNEASRFEPRSPYAIAKEFAHRMTVYWREAHKLHATNGILFNHESPRRGEAFVTRKIALAVAGIERGTQQVLHLGSLDARRDWGHARDYVDGMWRMLQQSRPDDYVLATGVSHSVRAFVERAFAVVGRRIEWDGQGPGEIGRDAQDGRILVRVDPALWRPAEVDRLEGDASKARRVLGWEPRTGFDELVEEMVRVEVERTRQRGGLRSIQFP